MATIRITKEQVESAYVAGITTAALAAALGVSATGVRYAMLRYGFPVNQRGVRPGAQIWTSEEKTQLRRLWDQGLTARAIGFAMNRKRDAVIGQAHRMGLSERPSPIRRAA